MHLFVEVELKTEQDIVCVQRMAIGKAQAAAQFQGVAEAVRRYLPRLGERRLSLLGEAVDVYQVGHHPPDDFLRGIVRHRDRVESLGLGAQGDDQLAAVPANLRVVEQELFPGFLSRLLQAHRAGPQCRGSQKGRQVSQQTVGHATVSPCFHARWPDLRSVRLSPAREERWPAPSIRERKAPAQTPEGTSTSTRQARNIAGGWPAYCPNSAPVLPRPVRETTESPQPGCTAARG